MAARENAVFAAFSYVVWAASATINGIEISRRNKKDDAMRCWWGEGGNESVIQEQERATMLSRNSVKWGNDGWLLWLRDVTNTYVV